MMVGGAKKKALAGTMVAASFVPNSVTEYVGRALVPDATPNQLLHAEELKPEQHKETPVVARIDSPRPVGRIDSHRDNKSSEIDIEEYRNEARDLISEYLKQDKLGESTAEYLMQYVNDPVYFDSKLTEEDIENIVNQEKGLRIYEQNGNRFDDLDQLLVEYLRSPKGIYDKLPSNREIQSLFVKTVRQLKDANDRKKKEAKLSDSEIVDLITESGSVFSKTFIIRGGLDANFSPTEILNSLSNLEIHAGDPHKRRQREDSAAVALSQTKKVLPDPSNREHLLTFIGAWKGLKGYR